MPLKSFTHQKSVEILCRFAYCLFVLSLFVVVVFLVVGIFIRFKLTFTRTRLTSKDNWPKEFNCLLFLSSSLDFFFFFSSSFQPSLNLTYLTLFFFIPLSLNFLLSHLPFFHSISFFFTLTYGVSPRGVVGNVLDCDIVVNEFEFQACYCVHIQTNTLGRKVWTCLFP